MHEVDLLINGERALLLDEQSLLLKTVSIAVNNSYIVAVGKTDEILKK